MTSLAKPATVPSNAFFTAAGPVGTAGTVFKIKVFSAMMGFNSPVVETTGDGDATPMFENNQLLYGTIRLRGAMIATDAIGLANIHGTTNDAGGAGLAITMNLGTGESITHRIILEEINLAWKMNAQYVGVSMVLRKTGAETTLEG